MSATTHARTVWVSARTLSADRAPTRSRVLRLTAGAVLAAAGAAWAALRLEVDGASMWPTLRPGQRVLGLRWPRPLPVPAGAVVAVRDPRDGRRVMLKRVAGRTPAGLAVVGDNPAASTDSRTFGPVPRRLIVGVVVYRYHPAADAGRVPRRHGQIWPSVNPPVTATRQ